ncbi:MAG: hypothetical protein B7Z80_26030 [Rhodospirillales bacterium 20-64-7]|nr:MAG: hypothetical protein B7Z80_26030 [Rhodospirillales bacterium 20-64-7]
MDPKERVISRVYYDLRAGFGSIAQTLQQARAIDPSITREDVSRFLNKQEIRQRKKPNRYNSFVPNARLDQIQIDLADFTGRSPVHRYGLVAIDSFTKEATVVPLVDKNSETTARALDEVLRKLGLPNALVTDEGGEFQGAFQRRLNYYSVRHQVLRTPPIFVERLIRTLKEKIELRLRASPGARNWTAVIAPVLAQYNSTKHTTTGMTPLQAREPENEDSVSQAITSHAKSNRKYESVHVGDTVKVIRKPGKYSEFKAGFNNWSERAYRVTAIHGEQGQSLYTLEGYARPLLRHELLRVEAVMPPPRRRIVGKRSAL